MKRGVVYISRIPHGFYEEEMKEYFSQFGTVTRLKLYRNKKTGKSKHFAFIEFLSDEVAQIVAETMNNYIMYNRLLKCELVPQEKINHFMWIGANKEFKPKSYLKEVMQIHNRKKRSLEEKKKRNGNLLKREKIKRKKLEKLGFEFEFPGYAACVKPKSEPESNKTIDDEPSEITNNGMNNEPNEITNKGKNEATNKEKNEVTSEEKNEATSEEKNEATSEETKKKTKDSSKKRARNEKVKDKGKNKKVKLEKDQTEKEFEQMDREMKKMDVGMRKMDAEMKKMEKGKSGNKKVEKEKKKEKSGKEKLENVKEKMGKRKKKTT
ncbi:hypothetical protein Glove_216g9 [Diversispora epigaea]|uniref:RRM domain-containing protein n=1 Tax=Diversispora epigaea TaxID=1348612 RepID=A0A397INB0_9GLOM|nr:hypothetical protein Glove_216g9 [Diversispora epigaea]